MPDQRFPKPPQYFHINLCQWDEPFSKKEARMMGVALGPSLQDVERETSRRTLAEVTNHREQAVKLFYIRLSTLHYYKNNEYGINN